MRDKFFYISTILFIIASPSVYKFSSIDFNKLNLYQTKPSIFKQTQDNHLITDFHTNDYEVKKHHKLVNITGHQVYYTSMSEIYKIKNKKLIWKTWFSGSLEGVVSTPQKEGNQLIVLNSSGVLYQLSLDSGVIQKSIKLFDLAYNNFIIGKKYIYLTGTRLLDTQKNHTLFIVLNKKSFEVDKLYDYNEYNKEKSSLFIHNNEVTHETKDKVLNFNPITKKITVSNKESYF